MMQSYRFTGSDLFSRASLASVARLALAAALFLLLGSSPSMAQGASPFGKHFIFAFPDTTQHHAPRGGEPMINQSSRIVIQSLDTAHVSIKGPRINMQVTVMPGASQVIVPLVTLSWVVNNISNEVYDITADRDIAIYCYYTSPHGSEAFRPLPVSSWGTEYYVMGLREEYITNVAFSNGEEGLSFLRAPAEIMIFASEYAQVTVDLPSFINLPKRYQLGPGDMIIIEVLEPTLNYYDFSGIRITSTTPVGVISGNTRTSAAGLLTLGPEITSPLLNAAFEWLPPVDAHGKRFTYRQLAPQPGIDVTEIIRVYATSPGSTDVLDTRDGTTRQISAGQYVEFRSNSWVSPTVVPFEVITSQPAEAMVVSGPYSEPSDPNALIPYSFNIWGAAMAELVPRERWINYGRFHAPNYPASLQSYVSIVAEPNTEVWLDGQPVAWDTPYPRFNYQHAEIAVAVGDHSIVARGGTCSAIAFGEAQGYQLYKPVGTRKKEKPSALRPHPSTYAERMVVSYAYPVSGVKTQGIDSLTISIAEGCDSTVAVAVRPGGAWDLRPLASATLDPASVNTEASITPIMEFQQITGYRIRFKPIDPNADASGKVVIVNSAGKQWEVPFHYSPQGLVALPATLDLTGVTASVPQTASITLKNTKPSSATVRWARLKNGRAGFTLTDLSGLPKLFKEGEELRLPLEFLGVLYGVTYRDTLIIETACRTILIPLSAITNERPSGPEPHIIGHDWRRRWLTTVDPCTKSGASGYDTVIAIFNAGGARFTVASVMLIGADADNGFFQLGGAPAVAPGDTVGSGGRKEIAVRFRPGDERVYTCTVRLVTLEGGSVEAELRGEGIESHVEIDDHDFGNLDMTTTTMVNGSVELRARPTRDLEVRGLRIAGGGGEFRFATGFAPPLESDPATWWHLAPGDSRMIPLEFAPATVGAKSATIEVIGDHASCDDSVGLLTGRSFSVGVKSSDLDFGAIFGCGSRSDSITLENTGGVQLELIAIEMQDGGGAFEIEGIGLPRVIDPGSTLTLGMRFTPSASGAHVGQVRFLLLRLDGSGRRDTVASALRGEGREVRASAHIERMFRGEPGQRITTPIVLDAALDDARVEEIIIRLPRRTHVSLVQSDGDLRAMLAGTIIAAWTIGIDPSSSGDTLVLRLHAPSGKWLQGTGDLLRPEIRTFLHDSMSGELPFGIELVDRRCASVDAIAGRASLDSICGLNLRLIELTASNYALEGNHPNPFNPETEIEFTLGLDAETELVVYDGAGREVARLVDGYLGPGRYRVKWDARGYPSGVYRYRIVSGPWSATGEMVLRK